MNVNCPQCQLLLECTSETAGQQVVCPKCSQLIQMPLIARASKEQSPFRISTDTRKPSIPAGTLTVLLAAAAIMLPVVVCGGIVTLNALYDSSRAPVETTPLQNHPGVLESIKTITLCRIVERIPEYEPIDAGYQEPRDSRIEWLGEDRYRVSGTVRSEGKKPHTFVADVKCKVGGKQTYSRIEIDGIQQ